MIKAFFINSSQALYTADELGFFPKYWLDEGVFGDATEALGLQVTQNSPLGLSALVSVGSALVELTKDSVTWKVIVVSDTQAVVNFASNSGGANRVDAVIVRLDKDTEPNQLKSNVATIEVVQGSGATALTDGAIDTAVGGDGWVRLANVTVTPSATQVTNANIADTRVQVKTNGAVRYGPKRIAFQVLTTDPTGAELVEGLMWYNSTSHTLNFYNGSVIASISATITEKFNPLYVQAQTTPNMTVSVAAGTAYVANAVIKFAGGNSPTFTAPGSNNRIDLLVLNSSGTLEIIQGTAAASPTAPTYTADKLVLAEIYLRSTSTSIKNTDDGTNGYINRDARGFLTPFTLYGASTTGTDAYAINPTPGISAYAAGQEFLVKADVANTGPATLAVSGLSAKTIKWPDGTDLRSGDIPAGGVFRVVYDGTNLQLLTQRYTYPSYPPRYFEGRVTSGVGLTNSTTRNQATLDPTGDNLYLATNTGSAGSRSIDIRRFPKDPTTGMYLYSSDSNDKVQIAESGNFSGDYVGIVATNSYVFVVMLNSGGTDIKIVRYPKDFSAAGTTFTISGTALTDVYIAAGDDSTIYISSASGDTIVPYTLSGTTATRGTSFSITEVTGTTRNGMWFDGTYLYLWDRSLTKIRKHNTSGTSQATKSYTYLCSASAGLGGWPIGLGSPFPGTLYLIIGYYDSAALEYFFRCYLVNKI